MKHGFRTMLALSAVIAAAHAGDLTPPAGAPAPTMKTLQQVEPRTPVNSTNTPGNPDAKFRITQPGSYYLTGPLTGADGKAGILILSENVTLDLNGFAISGGDTGVRAEGAALQGLTIRNGTITGAANFGLVLSSADGSRVENILASNNGLTGIQVGSNSLVIDCVGRNNGTGFYASGGSVAFVRCVALGNATNGFRASDASSFEACRAEENANSGIDADGAYDAVIRNCILRDNGINGATAGLRAIVTDCKISYNGVDGLRLSSFCIASRNACNNNGAINPGAGIYVASLGNRIEDNMLIGNDYGIRADAAGVTDNMIIRNTARANSLSNYLVGASNELATIVTNPGSNGYSTATPWSNFSY